jgi:hypothetical protein
MTVVWGKIKMWLTRNRPDFTVPPSSRVDGAQAVEARRRAEQDLSTARVQTGEAMRLAGSLREMRLQNHFGESVEAAFARRR